MQTAGQIQRPSQSETHTTSITSANSSSSQSRTVHTEFQLPDLTNQFPYNPGHSADEEDQSYVEKNIVLEYLEGIYRKLENQLSDMYQLVRSGNSWILPPNPIVKVRQLLMRGKSDPTAFFYPRVYVFFPHITYPGLIVACPNRDENKKCGRKIVTCGIYSHENTDLISLL
jgi:hypothetical protein